MSTPRVRFGRTVIAGQDFGRDLRAALRTLAHARAFSLVAVLLVALGVGTSTTLFTLVERVLLRPLPFPQPERLVRVFEKSPERGVARAGVARGNLAQWRRETRLIEGLALGYAMGRTLGDASGSEVILSAQVTCDFLPLLGVAPLHGRTFTDEECRRATYSNAATPVGADPVVVLGHGLWRGRFGGDPAIVGRTVTLERQPFRVIGVLPTGVDLPEPGVEAFLGWELEDSLPRDQRYTAALARLRPGVSLAAAQAELEGIAARIAREHPDTNRGWSVSLVPLHEHATGAARPVLLALLGASALVLLIACANVAFLFLARGAARSRDAAVHLALGATPGRILRHGLLEAGLLAAAGGALGCAAAALAIRTMPRAWPELPRAGELALDGYALLFALAASLAAALVAGALPAWRVARTDPRSAFEAGARTTAGRHAQGTRDLLVVAEVALTLVLLAGAGLLVRSVSALRSADPGFDPDGVLVAPIFLDGLEYGTGDQSRDYYARLFARLRTLPGADAVGGATTLPASPLGPDFERPVWPLERAGDERAVKQAWVRMITPGYLEALRIPVVAGRPFDSRDAPGTPRVLAVSETLARALWPGESALGKSLVVDYSTAGTYPYTVVGVVGDVRFRGPRSHPLAEVYFPHAQRPYLILNVAVRAKDGSASLAASVRQVLHDLDPQKPAHGVHRLPDLLGATFARERRAMQLLVAFAAVAGLLSALGVYGTLAYRVRQRETEIGVRVALGASRAQIARWVAGQGARLVARGAVVGLAGAIAAGRLLGNLLYGVEAADPVTGGLVLGVLALLGLFASGLPAWRAARLDPAALLRRG